MNVDKALLFLILAGLAAGRATAQDTTTTVTTTTSVTVLETTTTPSAAPDTTVTVAVTTMTQRINYDEIAPNENATHTSFEEATAVTEEQAHSDWLATASLDDNFTEDATSAEYTNFTQLTAGKARSRSRGEAYKPTLEGFDGTVRLQADGPLKNKIIYASAGHGWTNDNTSTSLWYTQRPVTHGMIEDFGNLDQMNLYADLCFRAGATVVPMRPLGFQHVERVIDNDSNKAFFYGGWADSVSTVSFGFAGARVPYRYAVASATETAVARFQPTLPDTDVYPVYGWARAGADRIAQTYRIVHAGGISEVDVDHRLVGNGWVYLGSYVFRAGSAGYVEITNKARNAADVTSGSVVIADAIRFGNGMGDVNRGGGISGFPREEESSRYWVERAIAPEVAPIFDAFTDRNDQSNNVGSAPRYAAHMNRETAGGFFDRVFMSFHSNAVGGRGVMGLYNAHAILRPDHQIELAKLVADELNAELTSTGLTLEKPWFVRGMRTMAHINFGEIRRDYLNNEMSGTINEVAFHDNEDDAELLKRLSIRYEAAEAAYQSTLRYLREVGKQDLAYHTPPFAPALLSARAGEAAGRISLEWAPSDQDPLSSPVQSIRYRVYQSEDGIAFDGGTDTDTATKYELNVEKAKGAPVYVRVVAVSAGGESLPSAVLAATARATTGPRVLVVQGAATTPDDTALTQTEKANLGWALRPGGGFARLVPGVMNNGQQVRTIGDAAARLSLGMDSIDIAQLGNALPRLSNYDAVFLQMGRQRVPEAICTTGSLTALSDYMTSGGRLLVAGANLAECDGGTTESLEHWGEFLEKNFAAKFDTQTTVTELMKAEGSDVTTTTFHLGDRRLAYFEPRPTEVIRVTNGGQALLAYAKRQGVAATATLADGKLRSALIGFPLEEIGYPRDQVDLVEQIMRAMKIEGAKERAPVEAPGHRLPRGNRAR